MAKTNGTAKARKTTGSRKTVGLKPRTASARTRAGAAAAAAAKPARAPRLPKAVATAVRAALDKKAADVVVLNLKKTGGFTDYFVICTGLNARHIHAIADGIEETLKADLGERPAVAEGGDKSEWLLLDYFNFVVHVFSRECRGFYSLERLWGNAERHEYSDEVSHSLHSLPTP
jgi:ribosome-associated protein